MITVPFTLLLTSLPGLLAAPQVLCAGCASDTEVDQDIVTLVLTQLSLGECQKNNVKVQNFKTQVVAGTKYMFDLVENPSECLVGDGRSELEDEKTCHVEVISQPWKNYTEVLWDQTTCIRIEEQVESFPCLGCADDSEVDQDIVDFVMTELSYGDCQKSNVKVENFKSQTVAGRKYTFDLVQTAGQCGNNGEESRCHVEVLSQPWLDNTEVLWDETTCERVPPPSPPCVGCADDSEVDQDIVEFVKSELSYGDCQKNSVRVENFKSQVVAGTKYTFELVQPAGNCGRNGTETRCHIEVLSQPWLDNTEVLWDETTCTRE